PYRSEDILAKVYTLLMRSFLLLLVLSMSVTRAFAQETTATVRGVILDARDGSPLRDVSVRLQGGKTVVTGDDGRFELTDVPVGTRELYVSVVEFMLVKRTIAVTAGGVMELTIPVAPGTGTYAESVTVHPLNESAPPTQALSDQ